MTNLLGQIAKVVALFSVQLNQTPPSDLHFFAKERIFCGHQWEQSILSVVIDNAIVMDEILIYARSRVLEATNKV